MKAGIQEHLIDRLGTIFGKPRNVGHMAEELAKVADPGLTETDLDELAANIIAQRKTKGFPSMSELMTLIKAVPEMKGRGGGSSNPHRTGLFDPLTKTGPNKGPHEKRTKEKGERIGGNTRYFGYGSHAALEREEAFVKAEKAACGFLRGRSITMEAIAARWAVGLLDFAIREGREPDAAEEQRIIAKVRANDVDARDFVAKPPDIRSRDGTPVMPTLSADMGPTLRALRAEMHARAEKLLSDAPRPGAGQSTEDRG